MREFSEITQHYTSRPAQKQRSATFPAPVMHGLSVRFSGRPPLRNFPRAAVLPLFPALHALPDDAVQTLEALSALPECTGRVVLLPYRAVGVAGALLPAFRPDSVRIDGMPEPMLLALSAQALTSDGAFAMVLPPKN